MSTPNDNPAGSIPLPTGPYWGTFTGTTIGADIDNEVWIGWDARTAWYHWPALAAGTVYAHIRPDTDIEYLEAAFIAGLPLAITEDDDWIGYGYYYLDSDPYDRNACMLQAEHAGGALTLVIFTYDPDVCDFTGGWGHALDVESSHWSTATRSEEWSTLTMGFRTETYFRHKAGSYPVDSGEGSFPVEANPAGLVCGFENASRGVVSDSGHPAEPCEHLPDGGGDWRRANNYSGPVGQSIESSAGSGGYRTDVCSVCESAIGVISSPTGFIRQPLDSFDSPNDWFDLTHSEFDQWSTGLFWGWHYSASMYEVGPIEMSASINNSVWSPGVDDPQWTYEQASFAVRYIPPEMVQWSDVISDTPDLPNMVWTKLTPWVGSDSILVASYLQFNDLGEEFFRMEGPLPITDDAETLAFGSIPADWRERIQPLGDGSPGEMLLLCLTSVEALEPPYTPPLSSVFDTHTTVAAVSPFWWNPTHTFRLPDWRTYIGFPLPPVATTAGWHIGRMAAGTTW